MKKLLLSAVITLTCFNFSFAEDTSPADKIYSVAEVHDILTSHPEQLKKKKITIKAYSLEQIRVKLSDQNTNRCSNYNVLIDFDPEFIKKYDEARYQQKIALLKSVPHIMTGEPVELNENSPIFPTQYGTYTGTFFDNSAKDCFEGDKRYVIRKKLEELPLSWPATQKTESFKTGTVIAHGKFIASPYTVSMQNNTITINDIAFDNYAVQPIVYRWTDKNSVDQFDFICSLLKRNATLIYNENILIVQRALTNQDIKEISKILSTSKTKRVKKFELESVLRETFLPEEMFKEFSNNWGK